MRSLTSWRVHTENNAHRVSFRHCAFTWAEPHYTFGAGIGPRARSRLKPNASSFRSSRAGASNSIPTGKPAVVSPAGSTRRGAPAQLLGEILFRVPAHGGTPSPVTCVDVERSSQSHYLPVFADDGQHFLFSTTRSGGQDTLQDGLFSGSLETRDVTCVSAEIRGNVALAGDALLSVQGTSLLVRPLDQQSMKLRGRANQTVGGDFPNSGPCGTQRPRRGDFSLQVASARLENLANRLELPCD
jgi:hypothetical protein